MATRLFIALELPESCRNTLADLNPQVKGLEWLPAKQLHVTLSFIGHVNAPKEERLREALGEVRLPAFFLPIQGVETFGGVHPRVVWAGLGKGHPHLYALH
ncbi:MAG TPA: RNA 2',3'-cyclic phosphodiesterase, partial [Terrimicrobium sp.]